MPELHELLAVEPNLEKTATSLIQESIKTFSKENLFSQELKTLTMFDEEEGEKLNTSEFRKLETTVDENLDYLVEPIANYIDVVFQKDIANQEAVADIILDNGICLAQNVPVTTLLTLESKINKMKDLYQAIPTLEPGISWKLDDTDERHGVYVAENKLTTLKTKKDLEFKVAYPATDKHPAQVQSVEVTINIGKYVTTKWSGKIPSALKAGILSRLDELVRALRAARMRANKTKVRPELHIGKTLLSFLNKGIIPNDAPRLPK